MPDHDAIVEIKSLSLNARHHLQDVWRNHAQVIASLAEQRADVLLPLPERERLEAIREAITCMSEDMRRLGL